MMEQMYKWSKHKNHHVRRLASEGSRPRLPWAIALPEFKKDPSPVLPILEILKNDPSEYVRRSVANNLNDISKDNPEIVMKLAVKWRGVTKETDAIVKHACRTLLKKADPKILKLFGVSDNKFIEINNVLIHTPGVKIGDYLIFSFSLINKGIKPVNARIEYAIYYLLRNGNYSKKVFKISERRLNPNQTSLIKSKRSFKPVTTRTFYPGKHKLAVIINGREHEVMDFNLCN